MKALLSIAFGLLLGCLLYVGFHFLPLPANSPVFSVLGISKPRLVGFLPYWLTARATNNYNPSLTTLTYFGFTIGPDGHVVKLTNPQEEDPGWYDLSTKAVQTKLDDAKSHNLILSLAVISEDEDTISSILKTPKQSASNLLNDILPVMKKYGFSDVNVDIESFTKADNATQSAFTTFVQTVKTGLAGKATVTVDIAPIMFVRHDALDPVAIGNIADYVVLMGYDFHTVISSNVGAVAPWNGIGSQTEYDVATALSLATKEIDPKKIILGTPLYGYEWDTLSSNDAAATIPNTGQTASNRRIETTFAQNCPTCISATNSLSQETRYVWQENKTDPYVHQAYVFDEHALAFRVVMTQQNKLAGLAVWALGYEGNSILTPLSVYKSAFAF